MCVFNVCRKSAAIDSPRVFFCHFLVPEFGQKDYFGRCVARILLDLANRQRLAKLGDSSISRPGASEKLAIQSTGVLNGVGHINQKERWRLSNTASGEV